MSTAKDNDNQPVTPDQADIQEILHKVIVAHQQALVLLQQTEAAYSRLIPHQLLSLLQAKSIVDVKLGDQVERKLSIMFTDIRNFTHLSETMTPTENFEFINSYLSQMEPVISRHHGIIDKYIGDAIMALFERGADDAVAGAIAMLERLSFYNAGRTRAGYQPIQIGIGLNTGMVMIGTVGGVNRMESTVIGDAVNLAARLEEANKTYNTQLLISHNTLYDLSEPNKYLIRFLDRFRVKGKSQPLSIYEVFDNDAEELRKSKCKSLDIFEQGVAYYHLKNIGQALPLFQRCIEICPDDLPAHIYLERCHTFQATKQHMGTGELDMLATWKSEFQSGIKKLDDAHQEMLRRINQYAAHIRKNEDGDFRDIFAFLNEHTDTLFPYEVALMRETDYPFIDSHIKEHQRFIQSYQALQARMQSATEDPRYLAYRTELLLLDWFTAHATKADRHFARHVQNFKAQQS